MLIIDNFSELHYCSQTQKYRTSSNTRRALNTGWGSDEILLIEAGGFYSRKYGTAWQTLHSILPHFDTVIVHYVSRYPENVITLSCYNPDIHEEWRQFFWKDLIAKISNKRRFTFQPYLCTTWEHRKPENCAFSLKCCMLFYQKHTKHMSKCHLVTAELSHFQCRLLF